MKAVKAWAIVMDDALGQYTESREYLITSSRADARKRICYEGERVVRVEIRELPPAPARRSRKAGR